MAVFSIILFLVSLILFVIGLISPKASLFWYKKERTRQFSAAFYAGLFVLSIILSMISSANELTKAIKESAAETQENVKPGLTQKQKDSITKAEKKAKLDTIKKQTITASDLVANYTKNEVRADENFKSKSFYVVGNISRIGKDVLDNIYVNLKSEDAMRSVQCYISDKNAVAALQQGQKITIHGECDGLMMNVLMKDCKLVDNLPADTQ